MNVIKKFPDTLVIIFSIMVMTTILTWIIPSGEYKREKKYIESVKSEKELIVKDSYHAVPSNGQSYHLFTYPSKGIEHAGYIVAFVLLIGGAFSVVNRTGAINAALYKIIEKTNKDKSLKKYVIPILMVLFSIGGSTFGMAEETLIFVVITIPMAIKMGYDPIVGASIPFIGASAGFAGAFLNPFTMGVAQGIAGLQYVSGIEYRLVVWVIYTFIAVVFVMRYANKILKDPSKSLLAGTNYKEKFEDSFTGNAEISFRQILILFVFASSIILLVIGASNWGWYTHEICALFLAMSIVTLFIGKLKLSDAVNSFYEGAKEMVIPAVLIGFAVSIKMIAEEGKILDTILYGISNSVGDTAPELSVQVMFYLQGFVNFFVPSGSGQAALTMPLMAPLSDVLGISRQTAVLAYQFGDGISNMIIPTSAVTMGVLSIGKIPYQKWFKFILPLMIILYLVSMVLLAIPASGLIDF